MSNGPSSVGPQVTQDPVSVMTPSKSRSMPVRKARPNPPAIAALVSTPESRAGHLIIIPTIEGSHYYNIGDPSIANGNKLTDSFVAEHNEAYASGGLNTQATVDENNAALANAQKGVLKCASGSSDPSDPNADPTITCLEDLLTHLLTGNLLDVDAKKLLCDATAASAKALKQQVDSAGNSLLNAAENLTSANAALPALNMLNNALASIDPGAIANCFGAQALKDTIAGKLDTAKSLIAAANKGTHAALVNKYNQAQKALGKYSLTPDMCKTDAQKAAEKEAAS